MNDQLNSQQILYFGEKREKITLNQAPPKQ